MLFKKINCKNCNKEIDICSERCPFCENENEEFANCKIPKNVIWIDWIKQLSLFLIGFAGLTLIATFLGLIIQSVLISQNGQEEGMKKFLEPNIQILMNGLTYSIVLISIVGFLFTSFKTIKPYLLKGRSYLMGLLFGLILIAATVCYNFIVGLFYETTGNDNEHSLTGMVENFPILSIIFFGIFGPIVEECTYRVGLFGLTRRINRWAGYLITCFIFAFIHFNVGSDDIVNELINIPSYLIAAFILTFAYEKEGIGASTVAHLMNNLIAIGSQIILIYA